jgi:hypothetical protein
LIVNMQAAEKLSLEQIRAFLAASEEVGLRAGVGPMYTAG